MMRAMKTPARLARRAISGLVALVATASVSAQVFYVGNSGDGTISRVDMAGNITTYATGFTNPYGLAVDSAGTLYVSSTSTHKVYSVTSSGVVSDYATGFAGTSSLLGMVFDPAGNLYVADVSAGVYKVTSGGGSVSLWSANLSYPRDVEFDAGGTLYAAGSYNPMRVYSVSAGGSATIFSSVAGMSGFTALDFDSAGNAFVAGSNGIIYKVATDGAAATFLGGYNATALVVDESDNIYFTSDDSRLYVSTPAGVVSIFAIGFSNPSSLVLAAAVPEPAAVGLWVGIAVLALAAGRRERSHL